METTQLYWRQKIHIEQKTVRWNVV